MALPRPTLLHGVVLVKDIVSKIVFLPEEGTLFFEVHRMVQVQTQNTSKEPHIFCFYEVGHVSF